MSEKVDATIEKVLDQSYTQNHAIAMQQANRENAGTGTLIEMSRASFSAAAVQQVHLASGILAQRSAQAQPQQLPGPGGTGIPSGFKLVPE